MHQWIGSGVKCHVNKWLLVYEFTILSILVYHGEWEAIFFLFFCFFYINPCTALCGSLGALGCNFPSIVTGVTACQLSTMLNRACVNHNGRSTHIMWAPGLFGQSVHGMNDTIYFYTVNQFWSVNMQDLIFYIVESTIWNIKSCMFTDHKQAKQ